MCSIGSWVGPDVTTMRLPASVLSLASVPRSDMTAAAIPHARQSWFDGCGHSPFSEDAPRFNAELLAFVRSCQGGRP